MTTATARSEVLWLAGASAPAFAGSGLRFTKAVLPLGRITLPDGRTLDVTPAFAEALVRDTNAWLALGQRVFAPRTHSTDPALNVGYWSRFRVEGGWVLADLELADVELAGKLGTTIRDVSVGIQHEVVAATGQRFPAVIEHVALTSDPVVPAQPNFVRLARALGLAMHDADEEGCTPLERAYLADVDLSGHLTPGGEFVGGFDGCVEHFMDEKGLPEANARRMCAFIGRRAGKIASRRNNMSDTTKETNTSETADAKPPPAAEPAVELSRLQATLAARDAEVSALKASVDALQKLELARAKKAAEDYVGEIRRKAVAVQSPVPEEDLKLVTAAFDRGDEPTARALGGAFLSRSEALGARTLSLRTASLGATTEQEQKELDVELDKRAAAAGCRARKG